jgi:hypothetical protein
MRLRNVRRPAKNLMRANGPTVVREALGAQEHHAIGLRDVVMLLMRTLVEDLQERRFKLGELHVSSLD